MALPLAGVSVAAAFALLPSLARAQAWELDGGAVGRVEYTDNYFFTPTNTQHAFTESITPFLTAGRRTETSRVAAVVAVGGNWVQGPSPTTDYVSGRFGLEGSIKDALSTWAGNISYVRSATLQTELQPASTVLGLTYTNAAGAIGNYTYALTDRWVVGAVASVYSNRYEGVVSEGSFSNNHGYYAGGTASYAVTEQTQLTAAAGYSYYSSDVSRSDSVTATAGLVHRYSERLTVSVSGGGFTTDITTPQSLSTAYRNRATGTLYGGQINYAPSENTQIVASFTNNLAPSASGVLSQSENAGAALSYRFSDRLIGRLGASYTRTSFPQAQTNSFNNNYYQGEIGMSYQVAERWTVDAAYRYTRARYSQDSSEPRSNVAFISIGYNWPGSSFTSWVGRPADTQGLPGIGPLSLPQTPSGSPGASKEPALSEPSPFDPFTLP